MVPSTRLEPSQGSLQNLFEGAKEESKTELRFAFTLHLQGVLQVKGEAYNLPAADDATAGGPIQAAHAHTGQVELASLVFNLGGRNI